MLAVGAVGARTTIRTVTARGTLGTPVTAVGALAAIGTLAAFATVAAAPALGTFAASPLATVCAVALRSVLDHRFERLLARQQLEHRVAIALLWFGDNGQHGDAVDLLLDFRP